MSSLFVQSAVLGSEANSLRSLRDAYVEKEYDFNGSYQREYSWTEVEEQALLQSVFRNMPIGSIALIRHDFSIQAYLEVVDGKSRILCLNRFFSDAIPYIVSPTERVYFSEMSRIDKAGFCNFKIAVNQIRNDVTELQKWEYFHRVNFSGVAQTAVHRQYVEDKIRELQSA